MDATENTALVAGKETAPVVIPEAAPNSLLPAIVQMAKDPSVDVAKLDALLKMQERMEGREAEGEFNRAFIRLQKTLPRIKKNGTLEYPIHKDKPDGPKRKIANFARWEDIDREIRPLLDAEGFALSFTTAPRQGDGGGLIVTAILRHEGGHKTETPIPIPLDTSGGKNNIQGYGSALSYGKRYAATAALNIITENEDDDGKLAGMSFLKSEQIEELRQLIEETGTDERRFLDLMGVKDLSDIQRGAFVVARNMLLQKRKTKGAA
jgi:hypothetical protein